MRWESEDNPPLSLSKTALDFKGHPAAAVEPLPSASGNGKFQNKFARWMQAGLFAVFVIFALAEPVSPKLAVNSFRAAVFFFLLCLVFGRKLQRQPLALPILIYLSLTALSTIFSFAPAASWGRMRTVTLIFMAIMLGQALTSMRQVRILLIALIASTLITVGYTAWQYTAGIGVELKSVLPGSPASQIGLRSGDIVQSVNGRKIRNPEQWRQALAASKTSLLTLDVIRSTILLTGGPIERLHFQISRQVPALSGLDDAQNLVRGRPFRAEGFFNHYVSYAGLLLLVALLVGGMLIASAGGSSARTALLSVIFLLLLGALAATLTRTHLAALFMGCLAVIWTAGMRKFFKTSLVVSLVLLLLSSVWMSQRRGISLGLRDLGNQYRLTIWRDGLRLIREHPLLGVGLDSIASQPERWNIQAYRRFHLISHFHSTPMQLAVECGLPVLIAWIWLMAAYWIFLVRLINKISSKNEKKFDWFPRGIWLGAFASLFGFLVISIVHYSIGDTEVVLVLWFIMGLSFAVARITAESFSFNRR